MANSIVKLTLESNQYERNLQQAKKSLEDFTSRIGINMKSLSGMAVAVSAVTGALKVVKDAFFKNEQQLDEWGRSVASAKALYSGFLDSLNHSDISGFLSRMDDITKAARDAYNSLDELNTFNAFNQVRTQKSRVGFTESLTGYRYGENSKADVRTAADTYINELRKRQELEEEAYLNKIYQISTERGVNYNDLKDALSGSYGDYDALKKVMPTGTKTKFTPGGMFGGSVAVEVPMAVTAEEKMGEALRQLNDTELQSLQALGAQSYRTGMEIAQVEKQVARTLNAKTGSGGNSRSGGSVRGGNGVTYAPDSIAAQEALVSELTKKWREAGASVRDSYLPAIAKAKSDLEGMMMGPQKMLYSEDWSKANLGEIAGGVPAIGKGLTVLPEQLSPLQQLNKELERLKDLLEYAPNTQAYQEGLQAVIDKEKEIAKFKGETKTEDIAKDTEDAWKGAASAMASVGSAMASIEDPTAKTVGIVMQAIATVAQAFSQALSEDKTTTGNIWAFIAAALASTASMVSVISSIHSATGYAQGGIVSGNSYSGDQIPIRANAGEVVLTRAMAGNLASQLEGNGLGNLNLSASVSAEQIRFVLNSNGRRTGRGEFVQTNFK